MHVARKNWTLSELSAEFLYTVIPALIEGLECQGHPSRVVSATVFINNVQYFISGEENAFTNHWHTFSFHVVLISFRHVFQAIVAI